MPKTGNVSKDLARRARSYFCVCFSPVNSDDEEPVQDTFSREPSTSNTVSGVQNNFDTGMAGPSHLPDFSPVIRRGFRSRFAISSVPSIHQTDSSGFHQEPDSLDDGRYVVHTSVDYTNCLVPGLDKIIGAPYYWGMMDRYEAEDLLDNKPEGTFLLRDSAQTEYLFSVSFRRYKRTLHARIEQKNHCFSFDFSDTTLYSAKTITDLIAYYNDATKCLFFEPQLTMPLPRNYVFSLQNLCRARIASLTTYDGVDKLNLPNVLKSFMKKYYYKHPIKTINHDSQVESSQNGQVVLLQYQQAIRN